MHRPRDIYGAENMPPPLMENEHSPNRPPSHYGQPYGYGSLSRDGAYRHDGQFREGPYGDNTLGRDGNSMDGTLTRDGYPIRDGPPPSPYREGPPPSPYRNGSPGSPYREGMPPGHPYSNGAYRENMPPNGAYPGDGNGTIPRDGSIRGYGQPGHGDPRQMDPRFNGMPPNGMGDEYRGPPKDPREMREYRDSPDYGRPRDLGLRPGGDNSIRRDLRPSPSPHGSQMPPRSPTGGHFPAYPGQQLVQNGNEPPMHPGGNDTLTRQGQQPNNQGRPNSPQAAANYDRVSTKYRTCLINLLIR